MKTITALAIIIMLLLLLKQLLLEWRPYLVFFVGDGSELIFTVGGDKQ